jgi:hypothetical protein
VRTAGQLQGEKPGTLAIRIGASDVEFLRQLESAIELKSTEGKASAGAIRPGEEMEARVPAVNEGCWFLMEARLPD